VSGTIRSRARTADMMFLLSVLLTISDVVSPTLISPATQTHVSSANTRPFVFQE
jgi:hypothetical protein